MKEVPKDEFIAQRRELYTKLLCELIKAKTVNPPGNEYAAAKLVKKRISKIGAKYKLYEKKRDRSNIVAKIGDEKGKKILISTHLDTVPAGDGWETDPFTPTIKDNLLYGRGACDNKGQATAVLLVLDYLKTLEKQLKNQFIFVFAADEETGSALGLKYLLNEHIVEPDYAIVVDVGGAMQQVTVAEKGVLRLKMTCKGRQAHGSVPHKGISAIANMSKFISKLDHYILKHQLHKHLTRPTINFGTITGGSAPNIVAGKCECVLDIRYLPSQTPKGIIEELKTLSERFGDFDFEPIVNLPPTELDDKHPLVQTIVGIAEKHGIAAKPKGLSGATDTKSFLLNDTPAVGFDFADANVAHSANEYCNLDNLFRFCSVLVDICLELDK
ncbi:M20 family metallopeptidase [Candidatus Woesearchaeota archaeon]|nr:M20 family metallopeptidase [Candidatus Woesearchaeota archaeon]